MSNKEKIKALVAKIRESLQITPYATMETVNDLLEIVDLKLADAGQGGGITLTGTAQGSGTVEGNTCTINTTAGA